MKRIGWRHYGFPTNLGEARGYLNTALGLYQWFHLGSRGEFEIIDIHPGNVHKKHLRKADLDAVVHFCPPHRYEHIGWTRNILFSMWETDVMPEPIADRIRPADFHVVPSRFNVEVWRRHGMHATSIPLGVGPEILALDPQRQLLRGPHTPRLRFLVLCSASSRKGWQLIAPAWRKAFEDRPGAVGHTQLYLKLINPNPELQGVNYPYADQRTVLDTRDLPPEQLAELYQSADVFVAPSYGEGFGLPALEAMAAGCLVIAPQVGGLTEFVSSTTALLINRSAEATVDYGTRFQTMVCTPDDIAFRLQHALMRWGTPEMELLRQNGVHRARQFTWQASGSTLKKFVADHLEAVPIKPQTIQRVIA